MENISKLIGKPVISIFDSTMEGCVKNVYVDKKLSKITYLCLFDDNLDDDKLVDAKSVYNYEGEAIMIKNNSLTYLAKTVNISNSDILGKKVYYSNGIMRGKIADFECDKQLKITKLFLQDGTVFDKSTILTIGNDIIIQKTKNEKLYDFRPKQINEIPKASNQKVKMLEKPKKVLPTKLLTDGYGFLIGRKIGQNLYAENGSLLAKKQSTINANLITLASEHGKLKELTSFSI